MKYVLRFTPEIEEDVISAYAWYEHKWRGLGDDFIRIFDSSVSEITRNPRLSAELDHGFRRLLRRFPYAIYYAIQDETIIVFGLFHCARDPVLVRSNLIHRSGS
jgi:plasmid stabilization system protein ParE